MNHIERHEVYEKRQSLSDEIEAMAKKSAGDEPWTELDEKHWQSTNVQYDEVKAKIEADLRSPSGRESNRLRNLVGRDGARLDDGHAFVNGSHTAKPCRGTLVVRRGAQGSTTQSARMDAVLQ